MTVLRAKWLAPMTSPLIENGALAVRDGRIISIGTFDRVKRDAGDGAIQDQGDAVIFPGLVNAHTHLELSLQHPGGDLAGMSFGDWILSIAQRTRSNETDPARRCADATREGIAQCKRFGVMTVGDISQHSHITRPVLRDSGLHVVSFGETLGLAKAQSKYRDLLTRSLDESFASPMLRIGLQPHAPYTVDTNGYLECLNLAKKRNLPLATHLAETIDEETFLRQQSGPFQQIWQQLGSWDEGVPTLRTSPIRMADQIGLLAYPTLLAHVNYCDDEELALLAAGKASVAFCPRTHRYFGHPAHRFREMLSRGINVAIGTDSCASSPDLNIVDDIRLLHRQYPEIPAEQLWRLITINGAKALRWEDQIGSLEIGKSADVAIFPVASGDPLRELLETPALPFQSPRPGIF